MNELIQQFVNSQKIAVVGVSDKKFGGAIYKTLKKRGYNVAPVHPKKEIFDGDRCYHSLDQLPKDINAALFAVSPVTAEEILIISSNIHIKYIWFQQGKNFDIAETIANDIGIQTIRNKCILMYTEPVDGIHKLHRFFSKLTGNYSS